MNKADVIDRVAQAAGVTKQQAEDVLDRFFDTVKSAVRGGDRVGWPNFGSFSTSQRKARTGRNPRTGQAVKIPASKAMKFSPGSALKEFLNSKASAGKSAGTKAAAKKSSAGSAKKSAPAKASASKSAKKASKASKASKR